jgi:pimeloyl-ACP methyl ester carboxylesterase
VQLINGYGPTESTTFTTCYPVPADIAENATSIPIGRPIANTQTLVLDEARQLAPIGVWGELHIGGDGLARGYLNRPELTAERFVANPYSADSNSRLYRTGDRVRWRQDGNLEFQGRLDGQVKLRGFRIELGEIEAALREHAAVADSSVVLREDRPNDKRLVAYWVPRQLDAETDLRGHLSQRLPTYMVPSAFVKLDRLPLTANGKLDRAALLAPEQYGSEFDKVHVGPRNAIEESLAGIWSELLGIARVGVYDNFFDLGGHSLLAVQVIDRINRHCKVTLKIADLFRLPTIQQLGELVAAPGGDSAQDEFLVVLRPAAPRGTVVWIGGHFAELLNSLPNTIGVLHLGLDGIDTKTFHQFDVDATVDRYLSELLSARPEGPLVIAGFSYGGLLAFALTLKLQEVLGEHVKALLLEPSVHPANRQAEPTGLRGRITRYGQRLWKEGPYVLYHSIRFRWKRYRGELPSHSDIESHPRWDACVPYFLRNIASYRPPHPMPGGVDLIASAEWTTEYFKLFQSQLKTVPRVRQVGDVEHLDLPQDKRCIKLWTKLIDQMLGAHRADALADPKS